MKSQATTANTTTSFQDFDERTASAPFIYSSTIRLLKQDDDDDS
jgi:hypothetical protein